MELNIKGDVGGKSTYVLTLVLVGASQLFLFLGFFAIIFSSESMPLKGKIIFPILQIIWIYVWYSFFTKFGKFKISKEGLFIVQNAYNPIDKFIPFSQIKEIKGHGSPYCNWSLLRILTTNKNYFLILFNPDNKTESDIPLNPKLEKMKPRPVALIVENAFNYLRGKA